MSWKDTPCAKCSFGAASSFIEPFDEESPPEDTASGVSVHCDLDGGTASSHQEPLDLDDMLFPGTMVRQFIQGLLSLEPCLRDIVSWRYLGVTYREIAARQGTSTQLAEMRHKRALRQWPILKALFPQKIAQQARRKALRSQED